ncbi:MAG: hypothetical protein ACI4XF_11325 [Oscillospiraceae bacterium]
MDKQKYVKDYLSPLIVAALGDVVDVRYTFTGTYEIVTVIWDDGSAIREVNVNVTGNSLLQMAANVIGRLADVIGRLLR